MHVNRRAEKGEATRAALMEAGRRLFAERGFAAVSAEEIVGVAGVTRGALYHHFDGKPGLFRAVLEQVESELTARFAEEALSKPDPWEAMVAGLEMFLEVCQDPEVRQLALIDAPSVLGWPAWRELEARHSLGLIRLGLQNLIDAGIAEPRPVDALAHAILGMLTEAGLYVANADEPDVARAEMEEVLRRLLDGLRAGGASDRR
jgi:AcrR family transcriptional regulator